jgi:glycosyltransferase involved in cell wall biosynthesis
MAYTRLKSELHIIFTGVPYPKGMAATKRIQHAIDALNSYPDISVSVLCARQPSELNPPDGEHDGVPYSTIMPDVFRQAFILKYPLYFIRAQRALRRLVRPTAEGVLLVLGPPLVDDLPLILEARKQNYKVVFDIVEDDAAANGMLSSRVARARRASALALGRYGIRYADGFIVISSRLYDKYHRLTKGTTPLLKRPISVDFTWFPSPQAQSLKEIRLFYSGSFGIKDGVEFLIDAFEILANDVPSLRLILVGQPDADRLSCILGKIKNCRFKQRIEYKGYLDDHAYYRELNRASIMCMTRIDHPYAHAGFPFKLGEYLASGRPVIASDVSDIKEFLTHKESALLVRPGNMQDLVDSVHYLLEYPERASAIGQRGRQVARQHFCYMRQADLLYKFIGALCGRKMVYA